LSFVLLLAACAQVVAPTGGKKDTTPPHVLKYTPDSAQLNFNAKKIVLDFDEYIQLKDLNTQLIISPPMEKAPDIKVKNKSLIIDLGDEQLKPNTTYSINFGTAVQDNNEGNPIDNFKYIFSTGDYIDSLTLSGKVQSSFNHVTEKGQLVMLYSNTADSVVYKKVPDYFGKTRDDGKFVINNIRPGQYKLFVLKDDNADYKFNEGESIAFIDGLVDPSEKKNILLDAFLETPSKFYIKKYSHSEYGKVMVTFNRGSDSIRVKNLDPAMTAEHELQQFSKNNDTLIYWMRGYDKDSLKFQVSNGGKVLDTLEFKLIKKEDALKSKKSPLRLRLINNFSGNQNFDLDAAVRLQFTAPVASINKTFVDLKEDSTAISGLHFKIDSVSSFAWKTDSTHLADTTKIPSVFVSIYRRDSTKKGIMDGPFRDFKEDTKYHLFILPGTFTDIFGMSNDTIKIDFKTQEQKFYGSIRLKVEVPDSLASSGVAKPKDYIVQLMDEKENLYREVIISGTQTLQFDHVLPKKYKLKIIVDENGNHKWDTGNYLMHKQPETVIYDSEEVNVRSNWDLDLDWRISY